MRSRSYESKVVLAMCASLAVIPLVGVLRLTAPAGTALSAAVGVALLLYAPACWVARQLASRHRDAARVAPAARRADAFARRAA